MRLWLAVVVSLLSGSAQAQMWPFPGPGRAAISSTYVGPGDVVASARMWWGLRAYSLATAGTAAARICNASDANCADVNTLSNGDFDVATATGAPLNCGGAGGTCTIRTLYDQTTGNNCTAATCNLGNPTIGNRPVLTFNCIGSKPCMTFTSASSQQLFTATNATSHAFPNTFSAVAQTTNTGAARSLLAGSGGGATQLGYPTTNNTVQGFAGSNLTATASAASYHALQAVLNSGSSDTNVDGTPTTGTTGANGFSGGVALGAVSGGQFMSGQILEAGVWIVAFSSGDSSSMSSNQHSYWGF